MAGQTTWNNPPKGTGRDFVVTPNLVKGLYYLSEAESIFGGTIAGGRKVKTVQIIGQQGGMSIDVGNESPVWQKDGSQNAETRFTMREGNKGMATYGDAPVRVGEFARYLHDVVYTRKVDSPAYPIVGFESAENIKRVVSDLVAAEKENIISWRREEVDFDAFRALFMGLSRGIFIKSDGGRGEVLPGTPDGVTEQIRSCWNCFVQLPGNSAFMTPLFNAVQHEAALAALLTALWTNNSVDTAFTWASTIRLSALVDELMMAPVKIGGQTYRAVALIDERNMYRLTTAGEQANQLFAQATTRADDNKAIYHRGKFVLNDILYLPCRQMQMFAPRVEGSGASAKVIYGPGMNVDPRLNSFKNESPIAMTAVLSAGALLRSVRSAVEWTEETGKHGKGAEYCIHYHDGWKRKEWVAKDGRDKILNNSSFVMFNHDEGILSPRT